MSFRLKRKYFGIKTVVFNFILIAFNFEAKTENKNMDSIRNYFSEEEGCIKIDISEKYLRENSWFNISKKY